MRYGQPTANPYPQPNPNPYFPQPGDATIGVVATMLQNSGLRLDSVTPGGPAAQMGLEVGDVITAVNGQQVRDLLHFRSLVSNSGGSLRMTVRNVRTGQLLIVNGRVPQVVQNPSGSPTTDMAMEVPEQLEQPEQP